jgi:hypothetical protein
MLKKHIEVRYKKVGVPKRSASQKNYLGDVLAAYENKWVALSADYRRVLASGRSLKEVDGKLTGSERIEAVFHKVLPFDAAYVPHAIV